MSTYGTNKYGVSICNGVPVCGCHCDIEVDITAG